MSRQSSPSLGKWLIFGAGGRLQAADLFNPGAIWFHLAVVLQLIVPGITVRAVQNDVPLNILQPAELISLSDYPEAWAPDQHDAELALPHGLLLDVTVDAHGQMVGYEILSGPRSLDMRRQLDQMLLFSRFRPMLSFGRPTSGGHVILSFSAVHVRG